MIDIEKGYIDTLKTTNEFVAREIVALQLESYLVESKIIGSNCIPTLYDTVDCIKNTDEVFMGFKINRELVGMISYKYEYGILDIHRLAVKPSFFKNGIAYNLLKKVIEEHEDAQKVIVATGSKNKPAIRLYNKLGFKVMREFEIEQKVMISQLELTGSFGELVDGHNVQNDYDDINSQRCENVMMKLIRDFAESRADIRAALINGSRVNPNVKKDQFQDYDIVYITENSSKYKHNQSWISEFGNTLITQQNDIDLEDGTYPIFLMQFDDGNRIDLQFYPLNKVNERNEDSLEKVLIDKDGLIGELPVSSDEIYLTSCPADEVLLKTINNILWCSTNVVKGLCRGEFNYAKRMQEQIIRADLNTVMRWYIADKHNWKINTGVFGKWMQAHLSKDEWEMYSDTCAGSDMEDVWKAMIKIIDLTNLFGNALTDSLGLVYPEKDEEGVRRYIEMNYGYFMEFK